MVHKLQVVYTNVLQPCIINGPIRPTLVIPIQILLTDLHHLHYGLLLEDLAESVGQNCHEILVDHLVEIRIRDDTD